MDKAKMGFWTPDAEVICFSCHGGIFPDKKLLPGKLDRLSKPFKLKRGNAMTHCNQCDVLIQLDESVARENNLVKRLQACGIDAEMVWTAGSQSLCSVNREEGHFFITYKFEYSDTFSISVYGRDGEMVEEGYSFDLEDEVVAFLAGRRDVSRIENN